jgi:hypothetical protein
MTDDDGIGLLDAFSTPITRAPVCQAALEDIA